MHLIIGGRGKMANLFGNVCFRQGFHFRNLFPETEIDSLNSVAVYFGSSEKFPLFLEKCSETKVPVIQGAIGPKIPEAVCTPVIDAPNLALPIIELLSVLPAVAKGLTTITEKRIVESHQADKTSPPGTAHRVADIFGIPRSEVVSVRSRATSLALGVPPEYLDGHGYHFVELLGGGVSMGFWFKTNGRDPYAYGAIHLAECVQKVRHRLKPQVYSCKEILDICALEETMDIVAGSSLENCKE